MKQFALFVLLFVAVFFVGCAAEDDETPEYTGGIIQITSIEVGADAIITEPARAAGIFLEGLGIKPADTKDAKVQYSTRKSGNYFELAIGYNSFGDFADLHGLADDKLYLDIDEKKTAFFREITLTFDNPLVLAHGSGIQAQINGMLESQFGADADDFETAFVFGSSRRRTSTNGISAVRTYDGYDYYFDGKTERIQIFDRYANTPVWYGIAVGGTGFFMLGTYYIIYTMRRRKNQLTIVNA